VGATVEVLGDLDALYADLVLGGAAPRTTPWVALCLVTSLDGSVTLGDASGGLGGAADRLALARIRDAADVLLVGAGTVRDEDYPPYPGGGERRARRTRKGLAEAPPVAMVTRTGALRPGHPLLADPARPPIVIAAAADVAAVRAALSTHAAGSATDVLVAGEATVDWPAALAGLVERGLPRVSCEGGPRLVGELLAADLVDEAFVTLAPALVGGDGPRLSSGAPLRRRDLALVSALVHGDELLLRYRRAGADAPPDAPPAAAAASR